MQTFETLMLRLTTNVTSSPASSARSSSAAWRMSSIASGRVSANSAVSSSARQRHAVAALRDRAGDQVAPDRPLLAPARAAARDEAPVLDLDHVEHALLHPLRVHVLRVDAEPLGERVAARRELLAHPVRATGRGARARCGRRWRTGRRGRSRPPRRAAATSRRGSAGSGCRRRASAAWHSRTSARMSSSVTRRRPAPAAAARLAVRCPRRAAPRRRSRPARRRSSAGAARSSGGSPPAGGRTRACTSASASSAAMRSSGDSPIPTRIPLVNGMRSSPAARIVLEPHAPGAWSASPGARRGRG